MADQDIFSNLKLRLSWGVAGNSAIDAYATLGGLKKSVYTLGSSVYMDIILARLQIKI